jgi:dolichol-phosphate mannosyltransferase
MPARILVFLPTLNESGNISPILSEINACLPGVEILIIDDGSTDGTRDEIESLRFSNLTLINRNMRKGIGSAHLLAIEYATSKNFDLLVTLDADGTHRVSDVVRIVEVASNYDLVIGSRFQSRDSLRGWSFSRRFLTKSAHVTTKLGLGISHDCSSGLRCYNLKRRALDSLMNLDSSGYDFFFKSAYLLSKSGFSIIDLPVILEARRQGESKMDFFSAFTSIRKLLLTVLSFRLRQIRSHFRLG